MTKIGPKSKNNAVVTLDLLQDSPKVVRGRLDRKKYFDLKISLNTTKYFNCFYETPVYSYIQLKFISHRLYSLNSKHSLLQYAIGGGHNIDKVSKYLLMLNTSCLLYTSDAADE